MKLTISLGGRDSNKKSFGRGVFRLVYYTKARQFTLYKSHEYNNLVLW